MNIPELLPADIILSRRNSWLSRTIRKFGKMKTGSARFSHSALALGHLSTKNEVIEALWKVTRSPLSKYEGQEIVIYRMRNLSIQARNEIVLKCVSVERQAYGLLKIPLFALDSVFKTYFFTSKLGMSNFKVCSNLISWSYEKVLGMFPFGITWRSVSPDTIDDYCVSHPAEFETVSF